tara:strand:+ start:410 stop:1615 length:1206 start_codon:yes stop_codon:yes gene_type:complete
VKKVLFILCLFLFSCSSNTSTTSTGKCIEGDCWNGQGTYTFNNGDKYIGEWKDYKRHGQGTYFYKSTGDQFTGEWKDNIRNGLGTITYSGGFIEHGIWKNAVLVERMELPVNSDNIYSSIHNGYLQSRIITFVSPEIISKGGYGRIETNDYVYEGDWNKDLSECKNCITTYPDNLEINGSFKIKESYIYLYGDVRVRNISDQIFNIYYDPLCNIKLPNKDYQNICSDIVSSEYKGVKFDIPLNDNTLEKTTEYTQTIFKKYQELQLLAQKETDIANQEAKQKEAQLEKVKTCENYGFKEGTKESMECIFKLLDLELEYAKLEMEKQNINQQAEIATTNQQANTAAALQQEALIKQQKQLIELQKTRDALELIRRSAELMNPPQKNIQTMNCRFIYNTVTCN